MRISSIAPNGISRTVIAASIVGLAVIGALVAYFGSDIIVFLLPLCAGMALAYRLHIRLLAEKTRAISEASRVHLATVEALATAIDARDQVGVGHVRRTRIYAVGIGRILGLSESDLEALRTGALLHDIGKLAVPDHILNKPGNLTPAELEKTKIHSDVGASILEKVGFDHPVVPTVRYHHECWDGSGYPVGLKGEDIPITARILSVADAFDTMRGARPYRSGLPRDEARKAIQNESGKRFDPLVVTTLLRHLTAFETELAAEGLIYGEDTPNAGGPQCFVEQIKLANREVFSLYELAREFGSRVTLEHTLDLFTEKVSEFVPFDTCAVYLSDPERTIATAVHAEGHAANAMLSRQLRIGQGVTGFVMRSREAAYNVDPDLDFSYSQVELAGCYSTIASVPLVADDELIGAITLYSAELEEYAEEHIRLLETISRIASDAISKSLKHSETKRYALTDPMTGLPNARSLQMQFEKEVARANRNSNGFQLLMLDLDGFKLVNDNFGHKVGDQMLREVGKIINGQLRDYDFLARYGGDEFVALVPETSAEDVADLCDRIEHAVSEFRLMASGREASVGVSLGSAGYTGSGQTFDQMIIAADKAMYSRKTMRKKFTVTRNIGRVGESAATQGRNDSSGSLIVELDERHVVRSKAVN
ncbi:MAG: diguanylate cyclase [Pyrinomonadaceae bacterium]|nr:diguanylate cyclase [Pyrinomonadaceae bacterium]